MPKTITLSGEPKSTQHIYGLACRGRFPQRFMTCEDKALKEQYQWEARAQWRGTPLECDIAVDITLYSGAVRTGTTSTSSAWTRSAASFGMTTASSKTLGYGWPTTRHGRGFRSLSASFNKFELIVRHHRSYVSDKKLAG